MCNANCIIFDILSLSKDMIAGRRVLEVGSLDVNGSIRPIIESWGPDEYIGIDLEEGKGVDILCDANNLVEKFGKESFDIIISHEVIEHIKDWQTGISNMKKVLKTNGVIIITTRSYGFPYHSYPNDFWRYEIEDMKYIFSDFSIDRLEKDPDKNFPGVFIKAIKPQNFKEIDLNTFKLYSIIENDKVCRITEHMIQKFNRQNKKVRLFRQLSLIISHGLIMLCKIIIDKRYKKNVSLLWT